MAEEGAGEKTEKPTGKKVSEARTQGMVGVSADLSNLISMSMGLYAFLKLIPGVWQDFISLTTSSLNFATFKNQDIHTAFTKGPLPSLVDITPLILIIMGASAISGSFSTLLQTKFLWAPKLFKPNFGQMNPIQGIKRIFSLNNLINLGKSILKLAIIGPIGYFAFLEYFPSFLSLIDIPIDQHLTMGSLFIKSAFKQIVTYLMVLAILDLIWQKWRNFKKLQMSKQEIKDEAKASEGDEAAKRKMISMGMTRARNRMMANVPKADVIVTNPTHISVALQYTGEPGVAPIVLAKGKGHMALRIREIATAHKVPIVERKPLARALFASVDVGKEIPYDLFKAVAEVLAYVYKMTGKKPKVKQGK
jgi:flagellar biosynthetic protein FlhB